MTGDPIPTLLSSLKPSLVDSSSSSLKLGLNSNAFPSSTLKLLSTFAQENEGVDLLSLSDNEEEEEDENEIDDDVDELAEQLEKNL